MRSLPVFLALAACGSPEPTSDAPPTTGDTGAPTASGPGDLLARGCDDGDYQPEALPDGRWRVLTEHYDLSVDASSDPVDLARLLEASWEAFGEDLGAEPGGSGPWEVAMYPDDASWRAATSARGISVPAGAGGYYDPRTGLASLSRQPTAYYTQMLLVHEAFHQFHLQARTSGSDLPVWYVEGLAEWISRHDWDGSCVALGADPRISFEDAWAVVEDGLSSGLDDPRGWIESDGFPGRPQMMSVVHHAERTDRDAWRAFREGMDFGEAGRYQPDAAAWRQHVRESQEPLRPVFLDWIHRTPAVTLGTAAEVVTIAVAKEPAAAWAWSAAVDGARHVGGPIGWSEEGFDVVWVDPDGEVSRWIYTPELEDWSVIGRLSDPGRRLRWEQEEGAVTLNGDRFELRSDLPYAVGHALYDGTVEFEREP